MEAHTEQLFAELLAVSDKHLTRAKQDIERIRRPRKAIPVKYVENETHGVRGYTVTLVNGKPTTSRRVFFEDTDPFKTYDDDIWEADNDL